jgi:UDP-N-acetylmuramate dehydrogenase
MIEQCGWKGKALGRAGVHDKQALVLVNLGGATGQEVVGLCETIRRDVHDKFDIDIHPEVNII